ncbi:amidase [Streptomyces sp. NPDC048424]|uniref:amidase n=1 Tax=Streptomyces sp. NPDC048424 TaxID=3155265 RepID=UPI003425109E
MSEAVDAAQFAFELGWKLRGLETALAPRGARAASDGPPQPPPPAGWQRFTLVHCPVEGYPGFDDPRYAGLRAGPPQGCVVEDFGGCLGLRCERPGGRLLDAVAELCAEIRTGHGLLMTGLGIEKLWEWSEDGTDGWGAEIVGQLLLMAAERGPRLGYAVDDLAGFLRTAAMPVPS